MDAHLEVGAASDLIEAWLTVHNAIVDQAAKRANSDFWHVWQQHVDWAIRNRHVAAEVR